MSGGLAFAIVSAFDREHVVALRVATGAPLIALPAVSEKPRFCPFCGSRDRLDATSGAGFIEQGCFIEGRYCYEGCLPGQQCQVCRGVFTLDVTIDAIHNDCRCRVGAHGCDCDRTEPWMTRIAGDA